MKKTLLTADQVGYEIAGRTIFKELSLSINQSEKVGLAGTNGCGKSTLLHILMGQIEPLCGKIIKSNATQIGYVEQFLPENLYTDSALDLVLACMDEETRVSQAYKAEIVLEDLGIAGETAQLPAGQLSGGQLNLIMFARALIKEPDLLLLDEPTNHLDLQSLIHIENYLLNQKKTSYLIVSHDADFLNRVTSKTLFIQNEKIFSFNLAYKEAKIEFEKLAEDLAQQRQKEERKIHKLEASAKRLANWGKVYDNEDLSRKAKSMEKRIDKLKEQTTVVLKKQQYNLNLDIQQTRSKYYFRALNHEVVIPEVGLTLYGIENFEIHRGDRIVLLGKNGCGKTTLIKQMVSHFDEEHFDSFIYNPQVELGYYDQEQQLLDAKSTIFREVRRALDCTNDEIKKELIAAGFQYDDLEKSISVLSGGERARVLFLILKMRQPNFIILDEPTNHIDLYGREELIRDLIHSQSTLLVTTHDRNFARAIATRFVLVEDNRLQEIANPDSFYQSLLGDSLKEAKQTTGQSAKENKVGPEGEDDSDTILEKIVSLEEKLEHNLGQKKAHQKPKLQQQWRQEIALLYDRLESIEG